MDALRISVGLAESSWHVMSGVSARPPLFETIGSDVAVMVHTVRLSKVGELAECQFTTAFYRKLVFLDGAVPMVLCLNCKQVLEDAQNCSSMILAGVCIMQRQFASSAWYAQEN